MKARPRAWLLAILVCGTAINVRGAPYAVVVPPEQLEGITRELSAVSDGTELAMRWQKIEASFVREPFSAELCWTPKVEGIYVGWTNVLTQYWFGPIQKDRVSDYLDSARMLRARLQVLFPTGNYENAGANLYYAKSTDCIPLGLFSSEVLMASAAGIKRANMERASYETERARQCLTNLKVGSTNSNCSIGALLAKIEGTRVDLMTNGSSNPQTIAQAGIDAALRAAEGAQNRPGDVSTHGTGPNPQAGSHEGKGKSSKEEGGPGQSEKKNEGLGILPGDAPEWVQRVVRAALQALGAEYLEAVAIVLYMIAPDIVEQAAGFFSGLSSNLVPEELSKSLDKATEFLEMAKSAASIAELIGKSGSLYTALLKANELIDKLPEDQRKQIRSSDLGKMMGQLDAAKKMLSDENVKLLLDGKLTEKQIFKLAERKARDTMQDALAKSLEKSFSPEVANLYRNAKGEVGPDLRKAIGEEVKKRAIAAAPEWARESFKRIDGATSVADAGEILRQVGFEREIAKAWNVDPAKAAAITKVRTAVESGDFRTAWKEVVPIRLDAKRDPGYQKAVGLLFDGKPTAAADEVLRANARANGVNPVAAAYILDKGLSRSALAEEVANRTGITTITWRQVRSEMAPDALVAKVQSQLRQTAYAAQAEALSDPKRRAAAVDALQQKVEADFVEQLSGDKTVKTLEAFRKRRTDVAARELTKFSKGLANEDALSADELNLLNQGRFQEASKQSLLRKARKAESEVLKAALEGDSMRAATLSEARAKNELKATLGTALSGDQFDALVQVSPERFEKATIDGWVRSVGITSDAAVAAASRGDTSVALAAGTKSGGSPKPSDEQIVRLRRAMERLDEVIAQNARVAGNK